MVKRDYIERSCLNQAYKQYSRLSTSKRLKSWAQPNSSLISNFWVNTLSNSYQVYYQIYLVRTSGSNSKLIIVLARYEFICQAHIKLITKPINEYRSNLFCIEP